MNRNYGRKGGFLHQYGKRSGPALATAARGLRAECDRDGGWRGWDELFAGLYVEIGADAAEHHANWCVSRCSCPQSYWAS